MIQPGHLLLLDLDGVVVFEAAAPFVARRELLRLHPDLADALGRVGMPVVVLTHRSRLEAKAVLASAGLAPAALLRIVAAEDLFREAIRRGKFGQLARGGLLKSLALSVITRDTGVPASRMAMIDDRLINLQDLLGKGVGLALHAPSSVRADGLLVTFDFAEASGLLAAWVAGRAPAGPVGLTPVERPLADWQRTGLDTVVQGRHVFNRLRRIGFRIRKLAARRSRAPG